jgi:hypothetical protein
MRRGVLEEEAPDIGYGLLEGAFDQNLLPILPGSCQTEQKRATRKHRRKKSLPSAKEGMLRRRAERDRYKIPLGNYRVRPLQRIGHLMRDEAIVDSR